MNVEECFVLIGSDERRFNEKHFIQADPKTVDINLMAIGLLVDHLRADVLHRPTKRISLGFNVDAPAKISDLRIEIVIEQNVL